MFFASIYELRALLKFYAAWVRRIEIGLNKWLDDPTEIENPMLARYPLRKKGQVIREALREHDQIWWCPDYNRQSRSFSAPSHQKKKKKKKKKKKRKENNIKGQQRTVRHFCSACYRADKTKLDHPQSSSACPYYKK